MRQTVPLNTFVLIRQQLGLAGHGDGRFPPEKKKKVRIGKSGFHFSSKQKQSFVNDGGKKSEEGRFQEIKACLYGREVRGQLTSSLSSAGPGCRPEASASVSLLAGAAPLLTSV